MREFFHGWRRKAGCVTLVMACMLMIGWMRSRVVHEGLALKCSEGFFYSMVSRDDTLHLVRAIYAQPETGQPFIQWIRIPRPANGQYFTEMPFMKWRWQAAGFGVSDLTRPEANFTVWTFPY